jgi:hypothetical protein
MEIKGDAVYRLVEMDVFELPKTIDDIVKIKKIMTALIKVKVSCIIYNFNSLPIVFVS